MLLSFLVIKKHERIYPLKLPYYGYFRLMIFLPTILIKQKSLKTLEFYLFCFVFHIGKNLT